MGQKLMLGLLFLGWHTVASLSDNPPGQDVNPLGNNKCGCTTETLPHPRIALLGPTGVGKSTFGNRLFGISEENGKEALCSQSGQTPYKFGVGHRSTSHTVETSWMVGHYLGDPANPCIAIVDSPGTGDTEGRDCDHGIALAKGIKEVGSIDAFMLLVKGTNSRFDQSMQDQIHLYTNIFGVDLFWKNAITEFTYWAHDAKAARKRKSTRGGLDEDIQHQSWNTEYRQRLGVARDINTVFIDPVYDEEFAEDREVEKFKLYTNKLWTLLTNKTEKFECDLRCKAPTGFFSGQPWLFEENALQNKRLSARASLTWNIWFAGCDGTGTKSYKIYHKTANGTENVIYKRVVDEDDVETYDDSYLLKSMKVMDKPHDKFKVIIVTIESVEDLHFGEYYVQNDKGNSNISQLNKIIDGEWADWGNFGDCSKTCIKGDEQPGTMTSVRECKPPQNGGIKCKGMATQDKMCAHRHGENAEKFRQCPVDATWSNWFSSWGKCSANCIKKRGTVPKQTRRRACHPERFGGKTCALLEGEAIAANLPLQEETQDCTRLPKCPKPASLGPWSEWSSCSKTCYPEGESVPKITRKRTCKKASRSTSDELNADILTCEAFGEMEVSKFCEIPPCPVEAKWQFWGMWTACSTSCGPGKRARSRSYSAGRNGAKLEPTEGENTEEENCNTDKKCPVAATWTWAPWSSWNFDCLKPDVNFGERTRERICKEGFPKHDFLNCESPPVPGQTETEKSFDIPKCFPLERLYAKISRDSRAGTDSWISLKLRNEGTPEKCETSTLDSSGGSWEWGSSETFTGTDNELKSCENFYPSPKYNLQFNFHVQNYLSRSDGMKIASLELNFGKKNYTWDIGNSNGWFNNGMENWYPLTRV